MNIVIQKEDFIFYSRLLEQAIALTDKPLVLDKEDKLVLSCMIRNLANLAEQIPAENILP